MAHYFKHLATAAVLPLFMQFGAAVAQDTTQETAQDAAEEMSPGHEEFVNSCGSCHGVDGKGAGFLVRVFRGVDPGDLTQLKQRNNGEFPYDRVFEIIDGRSEVAAHGDRKMPVWGDRYMQHEMDMQMWRDYEQQMQRDMTRAMDGTGTGNGPMANGQMDEDETDRTDEFRQRVRDRIFNLTDYLESIQEE